jgi:hypothetical protein
MSAIKIIIYSMAALLGLFILIGIWYGFMFFWMTIKLIILAVAIGYGFYLFKKFNKRSQ